MTKDKVKAVVVSKECLMDDIFSLTIKVGENISKAVPGQFIDLYSNDKSRMLPRPISICDVDSEKEEMRIVFRTVGAGTSEFSTYEKGDTVEIVGPLGNGYDIKDADKDKVHVLLGGGIGIPPMLYLAKKLNEAGVPKDNIKTVIGVRDKNTFLVEDLEKYSQVFITSDNGEAGIKGNVIDGIREYKINADYLYACGPGPMLKGVKAYAAEKGIPAQISLEERMACGIGACLACVCKTKEIDDHSKVKNTRICKDGPVFAAEEVEL